MLCDAGGSGDSRAGVSACCRDDRTPKPAFDAHCRVFAELGPRLRGSDAAAPDGMSDPNVTDPTR
ncbi:hypothetical protein [Streptomyces sp. TLI_171]|uniref:hypothetical protein n=1 Tax=Streptomyces sp. TLI_171 TaxID=1938859 RepID=UPI000C1789A1|nr:hypothetical protein [Streptomyces sp. TLI_171]